MPQTENQLKALDKIVRNDGFMTAEMDNELVMMSIEKSSYFGMDYIGKIIWEQLENPITITQICHNLVQRFAVEEEQCMQEILPFLQELAIEGMIRTVS